MEKHYLYRRFAIVVQAEEVTRPSQTQWKTLDPPIKESSSFLFLPGNKGVLQRRLPCITCPWPCRSFDLQNYKHWVVTPTHSLYPQIFSLDAHVQVCMFLLTAPPRYVYFDRDKVGVTIYCKNAYPGNVKHSDFVSTVEQIAKRQDWDSQTEHIKRHLHQNEYQREQ